MFPIALILSCFCVAPTQRMMIPRDTTPAFTAAEFQAALELFGPDPGAAERARELELAIRSPEGTPNGQLSQPKESSVLHQGFRLNHRGSSGTVGGAAKSTKGCACRH